LIVSSRLWLPISATKDTVQEYEKTKNKIREPKPAGESVLCLGRVRGLAPGELIERFAMADRFT